MQQPTALTSAQMLRNLSVTVLLLANDVIAEQSLKAIRSSERCWYQLSPLYAAQHAERHALFLSIHFKLNMPQVDKVTFLPIVFWTFIIYVGGFLFLNSTSLFTFLSSLKLTGKRAVRKYAAALVGRRLLSSLLFFPWIAL